MHLARSCLVFTGKPTFLVRFILPDGKGSLDRIKTHPEIIISIWYTKDIEIQTGKNPVVPGLAEEAVDG